MSSDVKSAAEFTDVEVARHVSWGPLIRLQDPLTQSSGHPRARTVMLGDDIVTRLHSASLFTRPAYRVNRACVEMQFGRIAWAHATMVDGDGSQDFPIG